MGIDLSSTAMWVVGFVILIYVIMITGFGSYFARFNKNLDDFFYSGQRFAWWLPAASMIATGIGSYSYLKYSEQGFNTGMSSALTYMNDWFIVPFFMFGWLPIIYFARVKSIPEYFGKRFNPFTRYMALTIIMSYMLFYIGYNLYSIGIALDGMFGIPQYYSMPIVALFLGSYVTFGGQTAVIFTDLFQGVMLYFAGGLAIFFGVYALGGFGEFWSWLPVTHRLPFTHLTENPKFNTAGLFWGEALAGSIAFTFMNQGFIMRYLTIKSINDCRKAVLANVMISLPLSAIVVGAVGWIGKALIMKQNATGGALAGYNFIEIKDTFHTFITICWATVKHNPWIFGFIIAALIAALMSTIDTLINACAAIFIFDIYKPLIKKDASDRHYLKAARWASMGTTLFGLLLVVWFNSLKGSLMSIHYKGVMIIIPSIVTTIFLGAFWKRFNSKAASVSMVVGSLFTVLTVYLPELIDPLSEFVSGPVNGKYIYMRALFGMAVTGVVGVIVTLVTEPASEKKTLGLTIQSLNKSMQKYKGGKLNFKVGDKVKKLNVAFNNKMDLNIVGLSQSNMEKLKAVDGDLIYIEDSRWFLGGLRSQHVKVKTDSKLTDKMVQMSEETNEGAFFLPNRLVSLEKIF